MTGRLMKGNDKPEENCISFPAGVFRPRCRVAWCAVIEPECRRRLRLKNGYQDRHAANDGPFYDLPCAMAALAGDCSIGLGTTLAPGASCN